MTNSQAIFKREKELRELFRNKEEQKNIAISYNVPSEGFVIWIHYDKEDDWDWRCGELILSCLIKKFKLDKIGYKERLNILRYKSCY